MPPANELLLAELELARSAAEVKSILAQTEGREFGDDFRDRVIDLAGRDPQRAARLAKHGQSVLRAGGDPVAVWRAIAVGERCRGRWRNSASSFIRSAGSTQGLDSLRLRVGVIDSLARAGYGERAIAYARALLARLEPLSRLQAARARLNLGNALLWQARFEEAASALVQARPVLEDEGAPIEAASATLGLSTAMLELGRWRDGRELALESRRSFAAMGLQGYVALCDINLGLAELGEGRPDAAFLRLERLLDSSALARPEEVRVRELLGDACLELNLLDEAAVHYRAALREHRSMDLRLDQADCHYGLAVSLQHRRRTKSARTHFERASRLYGVLNNPVYAALAGLRAARLSPRPQRPVDYELSKAYARSLSGVSASRFTAEAFLACAELAPVASDAERWARKAARCADSCGAYRVGASAYALLAELSPRSRRTYLRRAFDRLITARSQLTSVVALERFFEGWENVVRSYLTVLLDSPRPRLPEALDAVRRSTSAALLDELLSARRTELPEGVLRELEAARRTAGDLPGFERRSHGDAKPLGQDRFLTRLTGQGERARPACGPAVYASTRTTIYRLENGSARAVKASVSRLRRDVDWLLFDLQRPMLDRSAPHEKVEADLQAWATLLHCDGGEVCPEPSLWAFPWQALPGMPSVALHPWSEVGSRALTLGPDARVLVWCAPSLEGGAVELEALTALYRNVRVCRTVEEARSSMAGEYDLLYVATHGRTNERQPFLSYLDFGGERLYATEVLHSPMRVEFAVLAACSTGRIASASSLEPGGWVRTALACGARACVASVWSLDDVAASKTLLPMMSALRCGATVGEALFEGRQACRRDLPHPYFHAALGLFLGMRGSSS